MRLSLTQLTPLITAFVALGLAAPALTPPFTPVRRYFAVMNLSAFAWCFGEFMHNASGATEFDPSLVIFGSARYMWFLLMIIGIASAATAWLFFTIEYAGVRDRMTGWKMHIAHVPLATIAIVGITNPWTLWIARISAETGMARYTPLALVYALSIAAMMGTGAFMLVRYSLQHDRTERVYAHSLALVSFLPTTALLIWRLEDFLGLNLPFNPTPLALLVFEIMVGVLVYFRRFAEIVPHATLEAFEHIHDGVLAIDRRGVIVAMNIVARRTMSDISLGDVLANARPMLASQLRTCLENGNDPSDFEMAMGGRTYRVRPRTPGHVGSATPHCVILLTDVTDLKHTEEQLRELHEKMPASSR